MKAIETLFAGYLAEEKATGKRELERDTAFKAVLDANDIEDALITFQYAAMRAAYYKGFKTAQQLYR